MCPFIMKYFPWWFILSIHSVFPLTIANCTQIVMTSSRFLSWISLQSRLCRMHVRWQISQKKGFHVSRGTWLILCCEFWFLLAKTKFPFALLLKIYKIQDGKCKCNPVTCCSGILDLLNTKNRKFRTC